MFIIGINSTSQFISENSTSMDVNDKDEFWKFVQYICSEFKLFIEDQAGYKLLWDDKRSRGKKEEASQLAFTDCKELLQSQ